MTIDSKISELAVWLGDAFQSYELTAQTLAANALASAVTASGHSDDAELSAIAAAGSAAAINLPALDGRSLNFLQVLADETGYRHRTPAQVLGDLGATPTGTSLIQAANAAAARTAIGVPDGDQAIWNTGTDTVERLISPAKLSSRIEAFFASSFGANGWQVLPSGLILQWGEFSYVDIFPSLNQTITYPIAFPNAVRSVWPVVDTGQFQVWVTINNRNLTNCNIAINEGTGAIAGGTVRWFALGD